MKIELDRREVIKLMILCNAAWTITGVMNPELQIIHDKLNTKLQEWDAKHSKEGIT